MRLVIPALFCLWAIAARGGTAPDTLTPPNGNIIYSPDCSTGGLGPLFGFVIPPSPAATYRWEGPGGFAATQASFTPPDTGRYILTVTVDNCPSVPDTINVQYFDAPKVEASAPSAYYCPDAGAILLSATANSPTLFWRRLLPNGASQYLGAGESLPIPGSLLGLATERLLVTANGPYGCEGADTLLLTRQGLLAGSSNLLACPGDTVFISAAGEGAFRWNTGDTTAAIKTAVDSASIFTVSVTDASGCTTNSSQEVLIANGAYVRLSADRPEICPGDSTLLRAAGGASYLWENGGSQDSLLVAPVENDTFRATITTAEGCVVKKAISVGIIPLPMAELGLLPAALCRGDSARLTLANPDTVFYDYFVSPDSSTVYAFTLENRGCRSTFADTLTVTQPLTASMIECEASSNRIHFRWPHLPQDTLYEAEVLTGQPGSFIAAGAYVVEGLISEEEAAITIRAYSGGPCGIVEVEKACRAAYCERPLRGLSKVICPGDSTRLVSLPVAAATYSWAPAAGLICPDCPIATATPAATTIYTRTAIDTLGCIYTSTVDIGVGEWPQGLIPDTLYACPGQPFFFCPPDGSYRWLAPGGGTLPGHCLSFPQPEPDIAGRYTLILQLPEGCRLSREVNLIYEGQGGCGMQTRLKGLKF